MQGWQPLPSIAWRINYAASLLPNMLCKEDNRIDQIIQMHPVMFIIYKILHEFIVVWKKIDFFTFYVDYVNVDLFYFLCFAYIQVCASHACLVSTGVRREHPGIRVADGCEPSRGCSEPNPSLLFDQQMIFSANILNEVLYSTCRKYKRSFHSK